MVDNDEFNSEELEKIAQQCHADGKVLQHVLDEHLDSYMLVGFSYNGAQARFAGMRGIKDIRALLSLMEEETEKLICILEEMDSL